MHLVLFVLVGVLASVGLWKVLGMQRFQHMLMLPIALGEQAAFLVYLFLLCNSLDMAQRSCGHTRNSVLLAGGDVDIVGMALLSVVWFGLGEHKPYLRLPLPFGKEFHLPRTVPLILGLVLCDAQTLAGWLMFESMHEGNMYRHQQPQRVLVAGGIVTAVQFTAWAYATYWTLVDMPVYTMEQVWEAFSVDVFHQHHFVVIFLLSWFVVPIIWSTTEEQVTRPIWTPITKRSVSVLMKILITLLLVFNIAAAQYALWWVLRVPKNKDKKDI